MAEDAKVVKTEKGYFDGVEEIIPFSASLPSEGDKHSKDRVPPPRFYAKERLSVTIPGLPTIPFGGKRGGSCSSRRHRRPPGLSESTPLALWRLQVRLALRTAVVEKHWGCASDYGVYAVVVVYVPKRPPYFDHVHRHYARVKKSGNQLLRDPEYRAFVHGCEHDAMPLLKPPSLRLVSDVVFSCLSTAGVCSENQIMSFQVIKLYVTGKTKLAKTPRIEIMVGQTQKKGELFNDIRNF